MMATETAEVADFYTKSSWKSWRWEKQFGDNMHHGYYGPGDPVDVSTLPDSLIRMTEEVLKFSGIFDDPLKKPKNIIDVGCGFGGTGRYFVKKFGANCIGINLNPVQVERAKELTVAAGLQDKVRNELLHFAFFFKGSIGILGSGPRILNDKSLTSTQVGVESRTTNTHLEEEMSFIVGDALDQPFPDGQFDLVWAFDVIDITPHKLKFVSELARIAAPGASIIITACCHRDLSPGEESLKPNEKNLLNKICKPYHLSLSCSPSDYVKIAQSLALQDFKMADWSEHVTRFWEAVNRSNRTLWGLTTLLRSGWDDIKQALTLPTVIEAYNRKLISYNVIACRKPE